MTGKVVLIKETKLRAVGLSVLSIVMFLASLGNLLLGIYQKESVYVIVGIIGILFFGYGMGIIIKRTAKTLMQKEEDFLIKIDRQGITDQSSKAGVGLIRWQEIESVNVTKIFTQRLIGVELKNPESFIERCSDNIAKGLRMNRKLKYPTVCMTVNTAKEKPEAVAEMIKEWL